MNKSIWLLALPLLVLFGCSPAPPSVSGQVTYNGTPLDKADISFVPANGAGTPFAAETDQGKYYVKKGYPGNYKVMVSQYVQPEGDPNAYTENVIPYEAVGNGQKVEIKPGSQTIDLELSAPE